MVFEAVVASEVLFGAELQRAAAARALARVARRAVALSGLVAYARQKRRMTQVVAAARMAAAARGAAMRAAVMSAGTAVARAEKEVARAGHDNERGDETITTR